MVCLVIKRLDSMEQVKVYKQVLRAMIVVPTIMETFLFVAHPRENDPSAFLEKPAI